MMKWTKVEFKTSTPLERSSHGVSIIGDKLFMFGGEHTARTPLASDVHELDLSSPVLEWRSVTAGGEAPSPRFGHGQCALGDSLYVFGGRQGTAIDEKLLNDLYQFNTVTSTWTKIEGTGDIPCPRSYHTITSSGDLVFVFGGCPEQGRLADLHQFNTVSRHWTQLTPGPMEGRGGTPVTMTTTGDMFVVGGFAGREMADIHSYNIQDKSWTTHSTVIKHKS